MDCRDRATQRRLGSNGPDHPLIHPGTVLVGRYEVHGLAGSLSSTAIPLKAVDRVTGETVVCKIPRPHIKDGRALLPRST
jgi:hypothetical protein